MNVPQGYDVSHISYQSLNGSAYILASLATLPGGCPAPVRAREPSAAAGSRPRVRLACWANSRPALSCMLPLHPLAGSGAPISQVVSVDEDGATSTDSINKGFVSSGRQHHAPCLSAARPCPLPCTLPVTLSLGSGQRTCPDQLGTTLCLLAGGHDRPPGPGGDQPGL
jgi:hypothetical protein